MSSMLDRGDSYRVDFLGAAMLSQMSTGLGLIQKPLRELYFRYKTTKGKVTLQERRLMMTSHGLLVCYQDGPRGAPREDFYGAPSILYWDAIRFVAVKGSDKKYRSAFEPLDNDHSRNKDNLFVPLEKKLQCLHQQRHPPMLAVVLRRTQGLKALDVHAFVCRSDQEAMGLVHALEAVHASYASGELQETGVFGYNPFGKDSVRSTAGLERYQVEAAMSPAGVAAAAAAAPGGVGRDRVRAGHGLSGGGQPPQGRNLPPSLVAGGGRSEGLPRSPASGGYQRGSPPPTRPKSFRGITNASRLSGSQPNLSSAGLSLPPEQPRFFQLTQEDFSGGGGGGGDRGGGRPGETYDYLDHINRTLDRPGHKERPSLLGEDSDVYSSSIAPRDSPRGGGSSYHHHHQQPQQQPYQQRHPADEYGSVTRTVDFPEGDTLNSQRGSHEGGPPPADNLGHGYSLLAGSHGPLPGYDPYRRRHHDTPSPQPRRAQRSPSPPLYQTTLPRDGAPGLGSPDSRGRHPGGGEWSGGDGGTPRGPRISGFSRPVAPQRSPPASLRESYQREQRSPPASLRESYQREQRDALPEARDPYYHKDVSRHPASPSFPANPSHIRPSGSLSNVYEDRRAEGPPPGSRGPEVGGHPGGPSRPPGGADTPGAGSMRSSFADNPNRPVAMVTPQKVQGIRVLPMMGGPLVLNKPRGAASPSNDPSPNSRSPDLYRKFTPQSNSFENGKSSERDTRAGSTHPSEASRKPQESPYFFFGDSSNSRQTAPPPAASITPDVYSMPDKNNSKNKNKKWGKDSPDKDKNKGTERDNQGAQSPPNWHFKPGNQGDGNYGYQSGKGSKPAPEEDPAMNDKLLLNQKKDAEIAAVVQNMQLDYDASTLLPHAPHGTNFERSLGYFP